MMVIFISQCEKKALNRTRRVLDTFADRIGDNTWQTVITEEGLQAVKKLLRKTASKNTAVSCHWIRTRARSDLLWVVGKRDKFNYSGVVAVNRTMKNDLLDERFSLNTNVIALLAGLAGFFHDVGKANTLFQEKISGSAEKSYEPFRHEWVSLRIFQAFVSEKDDKTWLNDLANITNDTESKVLEQIIALKDGVAENIKQPFDSLPPVARFVAWLIVSHHRLPVWTKGSDNPPDLNQIKAWRTERFEPCWNSPQCLNTDWKPQDIAKNWDFPNGTPMLSAHWQTQISILAKKILRHERIFIQCWLDQHFTAHLARLSLMLADHYYSSDKPEIKITPEWQDRNYKAYANTCKNEQGEREFKQKLDEHNIEVGIYAEKIAKSLPRLRSELPVLSSNKKLSQQTKNEEFNWQNEAYNLAEKIHTETKQYGFFGICNASTGKGKTLANARIMYALSEKGKCRFNIALGLRTLTIQTAKALEKDLELEKGELAMLIGSQAVKDLHHDNQTELNSKQENEGRGSAEPLLKDDVDIFADIIDYQGDFNQWIEHDPNILKLIQSPILVSTIDYLMPANESLRGGRQIAPMLRLLTSDLILDEPDDFGLQDLPALCRLVNWAGMLGSRVLLSTATMPPVLATALFEAYQAGRKQYTEVNGEQGVTNTVYCAWFDEFKKPIAEKISSKETFEQAHKQFIDKRVSNLHKQNAALRKGKLIDIHATKDTTLNPSQWLAHSIKQSIEALHDQHAISLHDKQVSIGLVRMANINPLIQVSKHLLQIEPANDTIIHYCIYHGQFPLIQRSAIERQLDLALTRKDTQEWEKKSNIVQSIQEHKEKNHIFVVIATSVAEVGRDHDYDWAIIEPSSIRSIIQLAGRVQRHRKIEPKSENIHIFSTNYKGLKGVSPNFNKPGFETKNIRLASQNLDNSDVLKQMTSISAEPRIKSPAILPELFTKDNPPKVKSFNLLEHLSQRAKLFGSNREKNYASLWWYNTASWCGELQRRQPFRQSAPDDDYCLLQSSHSQGLRWQEKIPKTYPAKYQPTTDISIKEDNLVIEKGNVFWFDTDIMQEIDKLKANSMSSADELMKKFTHISLTKLNDNTAEQWRWHSHLGVYKILKKDRWKND